MSTKVEFDVIVNLGVKDVLDLIQGKARTVSAGPPGAAMVQANARVSFIGSDEEKRQIVDAFTRGPNTSYDSGFSITRWGEKAPVPGSTEWLMLIASNADRIWVKATRSGVLVDVPLLSASEEEQRIAVHAWLSGHAVPQFRVEPPAPDTHHTKRLRLLTAMSKTPRDELNTWLNRMGQAARSLLAEAELKVHVMTLVLGGSPEYIAQAYEAGTGLGWWRVDMSAPTPGPALKALEEKIGHLLPPTPSFADPRKLTYASPPRVAKAASFGVPVGTPVSAAIVEAEDDEVIVDDYGLTAEDMKHTPAAPAPEPSGAGLAEALRALRHGKT